jgi:Cu+-exporting ATPase
VNILIRPLLALAAALLIGFGGSAVADEPAPAPTVITISDLDCPSCAKKLAAKLSALEGVAKVETDVDKQTATITPKANVKLSPKQIWEVVEKEKYTPAKIEGPAGTFTAKPKV